MITKLTYLDENNDQRCLLKDDGWTISLQISDMGGFPCYVASHTDGSAITISERIVVLVVEISLPRAQN
jgi:hypothetical protein